jgi:hypothetical protein
MGAWTEAVYLLATHARKHGAQLDSAINVTDYQNWFAPATPTTLFIDWLINSQNRSFGYPLPEPKKLQDLLESVFLSSNPLSNDFQLHLNESELTARWSKSTGDAGKLTKRFVSTIISSAHLWKMIFANQIDDDAIKTLTRYALYRSDLPTVSNYRPSQLLLAYQRLVAKGVGIQLAGNFLRDCGAHWGFKGDRHLQRMLSLIYFDVQDGFTDPTGSISLVLAIELANSMQCELARLDKLLWVASSARLPGAKGRSWTRQQGKNMERNLASIIRLSIPDTSPVEANSDSCGRQRNNSSTKAKKAIHEKGSRNHVDYFVDNHVVCSRFHRRSGS